MNIKQLTYPSVKIQEQYWIDKEAQLNNATTETRREFNAIVERMAEALRQFNLSPHSSSVRREANEALKAWDDRLRLSHGEQSTTANPKPKDIGGNELPDRIEANQDWYEVERNDFDRGDLRDEGRNPDGSGESLSERNH